MYNYNTCLHKQIKTQIENSFLIFFYALNSNTESVNDGFNY